MDSLILDTVVGMVFVFAVFTFAVSGVVEGLARLMGLRAEFLLRGVSSMLNSDTGFGKNWVSKVVQTTFDKQVKAAKERVIKAKGDLAADAPAHAEIDEAFQLVIDHLTAAIESKETGARDVSAAKAAVTAARSELAASRVTTEAMAPNDAARAVALQKLEDAEEALLLAEDAVGVVTPGAPAVSVVSVLSQPVVDLTEALEVPDGLKADLNKLTEWKTKRRLPSYMSARTFSAALMRTLVPDPANGKTTEEQLRAAVDKLGVATIADTKLRTVLQTHLDTATSDSAKTVDAFRTRVEEWYDDHMKRVSGWYKRYTRWWTLGVAAVLAIFFNVNAVAMAQALYTDEALRESVVTAAFAASDCTAEDTADTTADEPTDELTDENSPAADETRTPAECLQDVRNQIAQLRGTGLPVGWSQNPQCLTLEADGNPITDDATLTCSRLNKLGVTDPSKVGGTNGITQAEAFWLDVRSLGLTLLGWLIIATASLVGARFWFDALSKLGSLRSSGPKPEPSN